MTSKMALTCLEKRELLNQAAASVENLVSLGESFEEAGQLSDALDFFEKAGAREALERVQAVALEEGDAFLFKRSCNSLRREWSREEWLELAKKAEEHGKFMFAAQACRHAGEEELAEGYALRAYSAS